MKSSDTTGTGVGNPGPSRSKKRSARAARAERVAARGFRGGESAVTHSGPRIALPPCTQAAIGTAKVRADHQTDTKPDRAFRRWIGDCDGQACLYERHPVGRRWRNCSTCARWAPCRASRGHGPAPLGLYGSLFETHLISGHPNLGDSHHERQARQHETNATKPTQQAILIKKSPREAGRRLRTGRIRRCSVRSRPTRQRQTARVYVLDALDSAPTARFRTRLSILGVSSPLPHARKLPCIGCATWRSVRTTACEPKLQGVLHGRRRWAILRLDLFLKGR